MNTGARLRNFHLANAVGSEAEVTLLQILQPGESVVIPPANNFYRVLSVQKERSYTVSKIIRGMVGPSPVTVLNYTASSVASYLKDVLEDGKFDLVQLESIHLISYLGEIRRAGSKPRVLLDWHNIESELMERYASAAKNLAKRIVASRTTKLLRDVELKALTNCDMHTVVSDREKERLAGRCSSAQIQVIPNGVDTAAFHHKDKSSEHTDLLFVGSMDYHANEEAVVWFVKEIWPKISLDLPQLHFVIVGRNPSANVKALASSRVAVTGTVNDVRPYYDKAAAVVVPLRVGGGTRLKILEAMALGVPVISTRLGAEGLDVSDGKDILLADTPPEIQHAVKEVLGSQNLRANLSRAGLELVQSKYDWTALGKKLARIYSAVGQ